MENQIVCPNCKTTISHQSIIDEAAKGEGSEMQFIRCECGERFSYWKVKGMLRDQNKIGAKFQRWVRSLSPNQS